MCTHLREFLVCRTQRVRVGGKQSKEVKVISGVPQGSVLGPLLFLVHVNEIWRYIEWCIRLFADDCKIYRKIINKIDIEKRLKDLETLGEWAVESGVKINPGKSKAINLRGLGLKIQKIQKIPESNNCKYLRITLIKKRFTLKLSGPSKLHSAKGLEGSSLGNACSQKRK